MTYIEGPRPPGCFFCQAASADPAQDSEYLVVARSERCLAILNRYPYNSGHLMVAPLAHLGALEDLESPVATDLMALTQRAIRVLRSVLTPEGFNVGVNLGRVAGAGVIDHVHQHVVPRWNGDTNFMPVIGEVKVLGEHLQRSYEKIRAGFDGVS
jgi:ATP adenylyltransferase